MFGPWEGIGELGDVWLENVGSDHLDANNLVPAEVGSSGIWRGFFREFVDATGILLELEIEYFSGGAEL